MSRGLIFEDAPEVAGGACCVQCKRADINGNGIIDTIDLSSVATKIFEEE